jgi:hypothetical protein
LTGWKPQILLEQTLDEVIEHFRTRRLAGGAETETQPREIPVAR